MSKITISRTVLEQALDALKIADTLVTLTQVKLAIATLREALADAIAAEHKAQGHPCGWYCKYGESPSTCTSAPMDCQCAIDAALAQPQQEPVAEVQVKMTGGNAGISTMIREIYDPLREPMQPGTKLYTSPQARKPLTDEEINAVWNKDLWRMPKPHHAFARAIESAHGITS